MIYLREATENDMVLVLSWRNNPLVWAGTYTQREPISWQNHKVWWQSRQDHKMLMIALVEGDFARDVGFLSLSPLQYWSPEIGIIIGEVSLWNKGIGTEAIRLACEWLKGKEYKWTSTTVLKSNKAMIKVLEKLNFKQDGNARKGELRYVKEI